MKQKIFFMCVVAVCLSSCAIGEISEQKTTYKVAANNCGVNERQPYLVSGSNYTYSDECEDVSYDKVSKDDPARTVTCGNEVIFCFDGLESKGIYELHIKYLSDSDSRIQSLYVDDKVLQKSLKLPNDQVLDHVVKIPQELYEDGKICVAIKREQGANAVISTLDVHSNINHPLNPAQLEDFLPELSEYEIMQTTPPAFSVGGVSLTQLDLDGTWLFSSELPEEFEKHNDFGRFCKDEIKVPGQWVQQGFEVQQGKIAGYSRQFSVPKDWNGHRIKLHFESVYSDAKVWGNGHEAGGYMGGFLPFEIDITELVKPGSNKLFVSVKADSLADQMAAGNHYARHPLGGIPRSVYLFVVPKVNICDIGVVADLDRDYKDGRLKIDLGLRNDSDSDLKSAEVKVSLRPLGIKGIDEVGSDCKLLASVSIPSIKSGQTHEDELVIEVNAPEKWHAEHPYLYELKFDLLCNKKIIESVTERIGFRKVEMVGNQVFVNGHRLKLRGACRHIIHPTDGRVLSGEMIRKDAELFRAANCNFIRTSHYPPEQEFLDYCDEYGLFVMNEAPFCWVWGKRDLQQHALVLKTTEELFRRDRNHPSIISWSAANESTWQRMFEDSVKLLKKLDPSRLVMFSHTEYFGIMGRDVVDLGTRHYPGHTGPSKYHNYFRPMIFDEYLHLNSYNERELATDPGVRDIWGQYINSMWSDIRKSRGCLGGSIWGGIDEVFFLPEEKVTGYGLWGIIDGWRREKPEYWHTKKSYSPFKINSQYLIVEDSRLIVAVENRFDSVDFSGLAIEWEYGEQKGMLTSDIPAGNTGHLVIDLKRPFEQSGTLALRITDKQGFMVDQYRLPVGKIENYIMRATAPKGKLALISEPDVWQIKGEGFSYTINRQTGQIEEGIQDGERVIVGGPHLMVLKLDNTKITVKDGVPIFLEGHENDSKSVYTPVCGNWTCSKADIVNQTDQQIVIKAAGQYDEAKGDFIYTINSDGDFKVKYIFVVKQDVTPRQVGIVLDLNKECDRLKWRRKGLWSVYPDDHIGRLEGVADAFSRRHQVPDIYGPRTQPEWPWSQDAIKLGSNDFRSTKHNIYVASLTNSSGRGLAVHSDATHHTRTWVEDEKVRMLIAFYSNAGAEHYFSFQSEQDRVVWRKDDLQYNTLEDIVNFSFCSMRN